MLQASIPGKYWDHCVLTSCQLINLTPSVIVYGKSPYEMLYGKSPSLEHLHLLDVYAMLRIQEKSARRSATVVLIGYSPTQKDYKLLDLHTRNIRDVVKENIFPSEVHLVISQIPSQVRMNMYDDEIMHIPHNMRILLLNYLYHP